MAICWLNSLTGPHSFRGQYLLPWLFYLAPPGFSSDWQGLQSSLWHAGYLVAPCRMHGSLFSCSMQTLSCSMWDLAPWPGIGPGPRALGMWSLSHWTTTASYDPLMFQMRKLKLRNEVIQLMWWIQGPKSKTTHSKPWLDLRCQACSVPDSVTFPFYEADPSPLS